jgi:hypothetical protein
MRSALEGFRPTLDNRTRGISLPDHRPLARYLARPCARGLKPERGAGSAIAAERSGAALIIDKA